MPQYKNLLETVNSVPEYAKQATENVYRNKVYLVGSIYNGHIERFCKTRKSAETYIRNQQRVTYYDEYFNKMVSCGSDLTIEEVSCFDIVDYLKDKRVWYKALKNCLPVPRFADNVVYSAKRYNINHDLLQWVEEVAQEIKQSHSMPYIEEYEFTQEETQEKEEETETESAAVETETNETEQKKADNANNNHNNGITVTLNNDMNGVEIRFDSKPEQTMIDALKGNGFRWSKRGFWYAKQSNKTLSLANSLNATQDTQNEQNADNSTLTAEYTYPNIDIDDLENYTVSDELQRRVHSSSLFEVDFKKECQATFQNIQQKALEVIALTDSPRIIHCIKKYLQSYKKRYYEHYLKILNHRANNPSWAVTGRGNLNAKRYNKMQDRYSNLIGQSVELSKEFNKRMNKFKSEVYNEKDRQFREKMNKSMANVDQVSATFTVSSKEVDGYSKKMRFYHYGEYSIVKAWGMFRIFKNGKEVETTLKTTDTLETAKRYVLALVQQDQEVSV